MASQSEKDQVCEAAVVGRNISQVDSNLLLVWGGDSLITTFFAFLAAISKEGLVCLQPLRILCTIFPKKSKFLLTPNFFV